MDEVRQKALRAKAQRVEAALTQAYGERRWNRAHYSDDVVGALVATVLSQNTSDLNSGRAFVALREAFPGGWDDVRIAPVTQVADAIRAGGLANIKAPRIQSILQDIYLRTGKTSLDYITTWDDTAIRDHLRALPGVGPKTAACVLMFNLGRPVLPVDTHVHRVAQRLGLIGPKVGADAAHDDLPCLVEPDQIYSFHVHLIEHGRRVCHARRPACEQCVLQADCDYRRHTVWAEAAA